LAIHADTAAIAGAIKKWKRPKIGFVADRLTGSDPSVTDYVLEVPARCLQCGTEINEKTLVEWSDT